MNIGILCLSMIIACQPPIAADYIKYDERDNKVAEGHIQCESTLFIEDIVEQSIISSNIEDGMIYSYGMGRLADNSIVQLLYIKEPITNNLIAASITWENGTDILYTFYDENNTTIYDRKGD